MDAEDKQEFLRKTAEFFNDVHSCKLMGKQILEEYNEEILDVINILLEFTADIGKGTEEQRKKLITHHAEMLHAKFEALKKAKFSEEQAFNIILAQIKPINFFEILSKAVSDNFSKIET